MDMWAEVLKAGGTIDELVRMAVRVKRGGRRGLSGEGSEGQMGVAHIPWRMFGNSTRLT